MPKRYPRNCGDEVDVALTDICGKGRGYSHDILVDLMKRLGFEREALGRGNNGNVRMTAGILLRTDIKSGKLTIDEMRRVAEDRRSASYAAATPPDLPDVTIWAMPLTDAPAMPTAAVKRYPRHSGDEVDVALTDICGKDRSYSHDILVDLMKRLGFEREALGRGNNGNVRMTAGILLRSAIDNGKLTIDEIRRVADDGRGASDTAATPSVLPDVTTGTNPAAEAAATPTADVSPRRETNDVEGSGSAVRGATKWWIASSFRDLAAYLGSIPSPFRRPLMTIARIGEKQGRRA